MLPRVAAPAPLYPYLPGGGTAIVVNATATAIAVNATATAATTTLDDAGQRCHNVGRRRLSVHCPDISNNRRDASLVRRPPVFSEDDSTAGTPFQHYYR
jgi:hypothetical protein